MCESRTTTFKISKLAKANVRIKELEEIERKYKEDQIVFNNQKIELVSLRGQVKNYKEKNRTLANTLRQERKEFESAWRRIGYARELILAQSNFLKELM